MVNFDETSPPGITEGRPMNQEIFLHTVTIKGYNYLRKLLVQQKRKGSYNESEVIKMFLFL